MFDIEKIRKDFPMLINNPDLVYFDSSATSFKPEPVIKTMNDYCRKYTTNIHRGDYDISFKISKEYDEVRLKVRSFINAESDKEIIFTSGATESLNLFAFGYGLKNLTKGDVILTTESEHASDILPWFKVCETTGARIIYIPLKENGRFDLESYEQLFIDNQVKIVTLPHISNVLGYINPIKEIAKIAHSHGAVINVDGAQSVPHIKVDVKDLDCDFISFSAHKMLGPTGVGVLYGKMDLLKQMDPIYFGGGSNARFDSDGSLILKDIPERFESGTPNIMGILALGTAVDYLSAIGMDEIMKYDHELTSYFVSKMKSLDNIELVNPDCDCSIISFNVKDIFAQDAASYLNNKHIAVRSGNHCAKMLHHIIGTNESIRASLYLYNTKEEIDYFIDVLKDITLEKCLEVIL